MKLTFICLSVAFATHTRINDPPSGWICAKTGCNHPNPAGIETCLKCGGGWNHNEYSELDLKAFTDDQNQDYAERILARQNKFIEAARKKEKQTQMEATQRAEAQMEERQRREAQREERQRREAQREASRRAEAQREREVQREARRRAEAERRNRQERQARKFESAPMQTQHLRKGARKSGRGKVKFSRKPNTVHEYPRCPTPQHEKKGHSSMDSQPKWLRTWQGKDPKGVCQYMRESRDNFRDAVFTNPKIRQTIKNAMKTAVLSFMNTFGKTQLASESLWEKVKALDNCASYAKEFRLNRLAPEMADAAVKNKRRHITASEAKKVLEDALELWQKVKQPGAFV